MARAMVKEIPLEDLSKESYFYKWYYHFKASLALYNRMPFQISLYKSGAKRETMIVFMEDVNGNTYSRKISANIADMAILRAWFSTDFEDIELELVNYSEAEEMLTEHAKQQYRDD